VNRPTRNTLWGCLLVLAVAGLWPCKAKAEQDFDSGNYMLQHCEHYVQQDIKLDVWDGECGGTINTLLFLGSSLPDGFKVCRPKGSTSEQAGKVVVAYFHAHPEKLHQTFRGLAMLALHEAWPCK
jgi:hypothetical protein